MKTLISTLLFLVIAFNTIAQETIRVGNDDDQHINTIFKKEKRDGFYGSFSAGYSPIDKKDGVVFSARGCWIMDHFFSIGVGGTGFINNLDEIGIDFFEQNLTAPSLAGGYAGLIVEPIVLPLKPIHLSFPILVGIGAAGNFNDYSYFSTYYIDDFFWVIEPQAELELNLTRWFRMAFYAGYRYTSKLNIEGISNDALRGYSAGVTFKMGLF